MAFTLEELNKESKRALTKAIIEKKTGQSDADWADIVHEFDLGVNAETLRKSGVGVKLAYDAGLIRDDSSTIPPTDVFDPGYMERQKLRDLNGMINKVYRDESRSELLRETVREAIAKCAKMECRQWITIDEPQSTTKKLVVCAGDFHYGASIKVKGLMGEELNVFDTEVFEERMNRLLNQTVAILQKEQIDCVEVFLVGDLLDGMLRQSQLMRLEHGLVESVIRLSESLASWLNQLSWHAKVHVIGVTGNHSEVRPLKAKAREFPDENLERIVFWYLHDRLAVNANVYITEECNRMAMQDVCGYKFLLLHGDGEKNIEQIAQNTVNLYGHHIDFFVCGHLHKGQEFPSGMTSDGNSEIIRVPSICGMDSYAQSKGYGGRAGATAMVIEKGYGKRCVYPIKL